MPSRHVAASYRKNGQGDASPGPQNPLGASPRPATPAVEAVVADLAEVMDGSRFGGESVDSSGSSLTVYVVRGSTEAAARAAALGCARPDVPITVQPVSRSRDQLEGLYATMDESLPGSVVPYLIMFRWEVSLQRNRVTVTLDLPSLTPQMRHDLWVRYGDAIDVWLYRPGVLDEPQAWWAG
jgi:hypothetical protein